MDCTPSHSGRWNLWLLLFRTYVCCSTVFAEEDESPLVFASEEPDGAASASFPPAALLEVDEPLVPEAPASRLLDALWGSAASPPVPRVVVASPLVYTAGISLDSQLSPVT